VTLAERAAFCAPKINPLRWIACMACGLRCNLVRATSGSAVETPEGEFVSLSGIASVDCASANAASKAATQARVPGAG
jgi:hypothetical protein